MKIGKCYPDYDIIGRFSPSQWPSMRKGHTAIISNDRGHLNPDVSRSTASPWGSFLGTWQMERKPIQLKSRTKLMAHLAVTDDASRHGSRASSAGSVKSGSAESKKAGEVAGDFKPQSPSDSQKPGQSQANPVEESSQQGSKAPTPGPNDSRPGTSAQSIQGSIQSPAGSRASTAEGSRMQSPVGSRIGSSESQRVRSALARSVTSPPSSAGSTRPRTASAEPHSRASGIRTSPQPQSRPESRMGVGGSGVQSPLGPRPPSSQVPLTTANNSSRGPTAGTSAGLQETRASAGGYAPIENQPVSAALAQTEAPLTTAT